jgi:cephalosporin hydroxylase
MNYITTPTRLDSSIHVPIHQTKGMHHKTGAVCKEYFENGLTKKYDCGPANNDKDWGWYPTKGYGGGDFGNREFSNADQDILKTHFLDFLQHKQERIVIVEIGVSRNAYANTSTSIFLENKRDQDIYIGIDIEDKSFLNNQEKNIYTIRSPSQNLDVFYPIMAEYGVDQIDVLMIDGWHSINQCYIEWELYTQMMNPGGMVVMHDTNFHPGPYFLVDSIDTNLYDVYKYLWDVQDWGISVAIHKGGNDA